MRTPILMLAALVADLPAQKHRGQGPVDPGPVRIEGLDLGTHWFGPKIRHEALVGKVVLVEYWGS